MSLSPQLPNLPDEVDEELDWAPAGEASPIVAEPEAPWYSFSLTRLIVATAAAPLPLLLVHRRLEYITWCCVVSCFGLFGVVLWTRARQLPRLNLTVLLMIVSAAIFNPIPSPVGLQMMAALFALPAIILARLVYPPPGKDGGCLTGCDHLLQVAVLPYAVLNMTTLGLISELFQQGGSLKSAAGYAALVVLAGLFVVNIYWAATDTRKTLDERPDLGYAYESTMILLPLATLVFCLRLAHAHAFGG